jgi:hypothetical protein
MGITTSLATLLAATGLINGTAVPAHVLNSVYTVKVQMQAFSTTRA